MSLAKHELTVYRPGVGIMLLSPEGLAFVGRRIYMPTGLAAWQMPQGGIEARSKGASRWTRTGYKAQAPDERATCREVHIHQGREA
jgi:hypothetical protein